MENYITLRELLDILELMSRDYGDQKIVSLETVNGEVNSVAAPYAIHLEDGKALYLPSREIQKQPTVAADACAISLFGRHIYEAREYLWQVCPEKTLQEGKTISHCSPPFRNEYYMEIQLHGRKDAPAWADAVLCSNHGEELCRTAPRDSLLGVWKLEYGGIEYATFVREAGYW